MRYDDRLETVLTQPIGDAGARVAIWSQLVDILAQARGKLTAEREDGIVHRLERWRSLIPEDRRRASARSLAGRAVSPGLVAYFGADKPSVAAPLLSQARLSSEEWLKIITALPPASRALLRERRDLPEDVARALAGYGVSDFALPGAAGQVPEPVALPAREEQAIPIGGADEGTIQISDLVARIEAYRQTRPSPFQSAEIELPLPEMAQSFRFETAADGMIEWVEGAPRGPIVGLSIAELAEARSAGVDGHAAGAFRQRNRFRDARLLVAGQGPSGGQWLISADPVFDAALGRFAGYRGIARRPSPEEQAGRGTSSVFGADLKPDSIRQLVHELRTPLNAIRGFAEMIQGQLLGPVSHAYRDRSAKIIGDANQSLTLFDDLENAARLETGSSLSRATGFATPGASLLQSVLLDLRSLTERRATHIRAAMDGDACRISADPVTVERMMSRLLSAVIGLASAGETLDVSLARHAKSVLLTVELPDSLKGVPAAELLDPGYGPSGEWPDAPALGLGFSLRLVANMADAVQGKLDVNAGRLLLSLPTAKEHAEGVQGRL